jgi:hypothetical protein
VFKSLPHQLNCLQRKNKKNYIHKYTNKKFWHLLHRWVSKDNAFSKLKSKRERQCQYKTTVWRVCETIVAVQTQQYIICVVELHVTVNNITILNVAQKCFCGARIKRS